MTLFDALSNPDSSSVGPPGLEAFDWGRDAARTVVEHMDFDGAHDAGHVTRVFHHARTITRGERRSGRAVDWEVVAAAALFHDIVNPPKDSSERQKASSRSARRALDFFGARGTFGEERAGRLASAIERHSFSRGLRPQSLEGAILRDADRLEAIGAIGIARCFYVSGAMEGAIADPEDPLALDRDLDDETYAVDHFFEKLLELRGDFLTSTGRALADERHAFLERFLDQFADEIGVERRSRSTASEENDDATRSEDC